MPDTFYDIDCSTLKAVAEAARQRGVTVREPTIWRQFKDGSALRRYGEEGECSITVPVPRPDKATLAEIYYERHLKPQRTPEDNP